MLETLKKKLVTEIETADTVGPLKTDTIHCNIYVSLLGNECLRQLEHWDRGLESHSRNGCLLVFILCLG
jgi:hypothetical protein